MVRQNASVVFFVTLLLFLALFAAALIYVFFGHSGLYAAGMIVVVTAVLLVTSAASYISAIIVCAVVLVLDLVSWLLFRLFDFFIGRPEGAVYAVVSPWLLHGLYPAGLAATTFVAFRHYLRSYWIPGTVWSLVIIAAATLFLSKNRKDEMPLLSAIADKANLEG